MLALLHMRMLLVGTCAQQLPLGADDLGRTKKAVLWGRKAGRWDALPMFGRLRSPLTVGNSHWKFEYFWES